MGIKNRLKSGRRGHAGLLTQGGISGNKKPGSRGAKTGFYGKRVQLPQTRNTLPNLRHPSQAVILLAETVLDKRMLDTEPGSCKRAGPKQFPHGDRRGIQFLGAQRLAAAQLSRSPARHDKDHRTEFSPAASLRFSRSYKTAVTGRSASRSMAFRIP